MADRNTITPSKGRIVFYQSRIMLEDGIEPHAAIITQVFSNDEVAITTFAPGEAPQPMNQVKYFDGYDRAAAGDQDCAWWWPPRV